MKLTLVRHGHASAAADDLGDDERVLSSRGRQQIRTLASRLANTASGQNPRPADPPGAIVCSPLLRAVQTAEILAGAFSRADVDVLVWRCLEPGGDLGELLEKLSLLGLDSALLASHEPTMGRLFGMLCAEAHSPFATAEARVIELARCEPGGGKLLARHLPS
jgi:phosphohistidine phosphatase